ncbi:hypothetical protein ACFY1P_19970 [Streptomyces sp. NPDC001407]|uniref:hypothetical protein n=1 Tax=Streptomyces sp. NPDC001407 TaxID=3364573 RepID=UPI0036C6FBE4
MTEKRARRCFCGCGENAGVAGWFVQGHDVTAAAALRAVEDLRLPHQLMSLGFGPGRSVVEAAVWEAGWVRCPGCAYVGPAATHTCTLASPEFGPEQVQEPAPTRAAAEGTVGLTYVYGLQYRGGTTYRWKHGSALPVDDEHVSPLHRLDDPAPGRWLAFSANGRN